MNITITTRDLATGEDHGTVVRLTGTAEDGSRVTFGGDARPMYDLVQRVMDAGEVTADIEPWQVLGVPHDLC